MKIGELLSKNYLFSYGLVTSGTGCKRLTFYLMTARTSINIDLSPVALVSLVILKKLRHILVGKRSGFFNSLKY